VHTLHELTGNTDMHIEVTTHEILEVLPGIQTYVKVEVCGTKAPIQLSFKYQDESAEVLAYVSLTSALPSEKTYKRKAKNPKRMTIFSKEGCIDEFIEDFVYLSLSSTTRTKINLKVTFPTVDRNRLPSIQASWRNSVAEESPKKKKKVKNWDVINKIHIKLNKLNTINWNNLQDSANAQKMFNNQSKQNNVSLKRQLLENQKRQGNVKYLNKWEAFKQLKNVAVVKYCQARRQ
jgi:hypothetical protein